MSRGLSLWTQTALAGDEIRMAHLVEIHFDEPTGVVYVTDYFRDIEYGGVTYLRGGNLLQVGEVEEHSALMVADTPVSFSGVDQAMTSLLLDEQYLDRPLKIRRAFMYTGTGQIAAVEPYFDGRMNLPVISEDPEEGTSTINVTVASAWVDFERSPGRQTNHEMQQLWFPGDRGFEFASKIFDALPWGKAA